MTAKTDLEDETPDGEAKPEAVKEEPKKPSLMDRVLLFQLKLRMFVMSREFTTVPTIMTLIGVIILVSLGTWQLTRLSWKNTLLLEMEENLKTVPEDLRLVPPVTAEEWEKR